MQILWRLVATKRAFQLGRELGEIERILVDFNIAIRQQLAVVALKEFSLAAKSEFPHLYGTPAEDRYRLWGRGTEIGLARARSDNPHVRIRGIALWLAAACHETRGVTLPAIEEAHRNVLGLLRRLKEWLPADAAARVTPPLLSRETPRQTAAA